MLCFPLEISSAKQKVGSLLVFCKGKIWGRYTLHHLSCVPRRRKIAFHGHHLYLKLVDVIWSVINLLSTCNGKQLPIMCSLASLVKLHTGQIFLPWYSLATKLMKKNTGVTHNGKRSQGTMAKSFLMKFRKWYIRWRTMITTSHTQKEVLTAYILISPTEGLGSVTKSKYPVS